MSAISQEALEKLYKSGKSMSEIASILRCSVHKVVYWMNKYEIKRRTISDALYIRLNPNGDPFLIKNKLVASDKFLLGLGIGIYWGEGEKVSRNAIRVSNTDPDIIKSFIRFLREICGLEERKLLYSLISFKDIDTEAVRTFWSKALIIPPEKFGKIVQIPPQGKGTYRNRSKHGVCIVIVSNPKLKSWIMNEIAKVRSLDGSVVERELGKF